MSAPYGGMGAGPFGSGVPPVAIDLVLANDQTESAAALTDATGLSFVPAANAGYYVEFYGVFITSAATNGFQWGFAGSGDYEGGIQYTPQSAATTLARLGGAGGQVAGTNAIGLIANNPVYGWIIVATGAVPPAAIKVQFNSEAGAGQSVTLKKGSFLRYKRLY